MKYNRIKLKSGEFIEVSSLDSKVYTLFNTSLGKEVLEELRLQLSKSSVDNESNLLWKQQGQRELIESFFNTIFIFNEKLEDFT